MCNYHLKYIDARSTEFGFFIRTLIIQLLLLISTAITEVIEKKQY